MPERNRNHMGGDMSFFRKVKHLHESLIVQGSSRAQITCPDCSSDLPKFRSTELTDYSIVDGKVTEVVTGYRVHCQACGHAFSIGPKGTFRHSNVAMPYTPQVPPEAQRRPWPLSMPPPKDDGSDLSPAYWRGKEKPQEP